MLLWSVAAIAGISAVFGMLSWRYAAIARELPASDIDPNWLMDPLNLLDLTFSVITTVYLGAIILAARKP